MRSAQEYSLTARLELGNVSENVTVEAGSSLVSTTSPEVTATVLQRQVLDIPLANRDVTNLIKCSPACSRSSTARTPASTAAGPTWTQVTLDGINIQDNFIRTNSLDFLPNRPTSDNVAEFSITTSVSGADIGGRRDVGADGHAVWHEPFTGSVFEFNRDANTRPTRSSTTPRHHPSPSRISAAISLAAASAGRSSSNKTVLLRLLRGLPADHADLAEPDDPGQRGFLDGVFRYVGTDGIVRSVNVMQLSGLTVDPKLRADFLSQVPGSSNVNNYDVGNSTAARVLNTAGFRFNQTDLNNRDQYGFRVDYALTEQSPLRGHLQLLQGDRRSHGSRLHQPGPPLVYTSSDPKR